MPLAPNCYAGNRLLTLGIHDKKAGPWVQRKRLRSRKRAMTRRWVGRQPRSGVQRSERRRGEAVRATGRWKSDNRLGRHSPPLSHHMYVPSVPAWKRKPTQNEADARQRSWRSPRGLRFESAGSPGDARKVRPTGADPTNQPAASLGRVGKINRAARPGRRPPRHSSRACQSSLVARLATEGAPHSSCWH